MTLGRSVISVEKIYNCVGEDRFYDRHDGSYIFAIRRSRLGTPINETSFIADQKCASVIVRDHKNLKPVLRELSSMPPYFSAYLAFRNTKSFEAAFEKRMADAVRDSIKETGNLRNLAALFGLWNFGRVPFQHLKEDIQDSLSILAEPFNIASGFDISIQGIENPVELHWHPEYMPDNGRCRSWFAVRSLSEKGTVVSTHEENGVVTGALNCGQSLTVLKGRLKHSSPVFPHRRWVYKIIPYIHGPAQEF